MMPDNASIEIRVPISPEVDAQLAQLASAHGVTKDAVARHARARYVDERIVLKIEFSFTKEGAWYEWDTFDVISIVGIALAFVGFVAAFFPSWRAYGVLVPLGLACMTFAVYGAQRRDARAS
jgi:hypothetical protein